MCIQNIYKCIGTLCLQITRNVATKAETERGFQCSRSKCTEAGGPELVGQSSGANAEEPIALSPVALGVLASILIRVALTSQDEGYCTNLISTSQAGRKVRVTVGGKKTETFPKPSASISLPITKSPSCEGAWATHSLGPVGKKGGKQTWQKHGSWRCVTSQSVISREGGPLPSYLTYLFCGWFWNNFKHTKAFQDE